MLTREHKVFNWMKKRMKCDTLRCLCTSQMEDVDLYSRCTRLDLFLRYRGEIPAGKQSSRAILHHSWQWAMIVSTPIVTVRYELPAEERRNVMRISRVFQTWWKDVLGKIVVEVESRIYLTMKMSKCQTSILFQVNVNINSKYYLPFLYLLCKNTHILNIILNRNFIDAPFK